MRKSYKVLKRTYKMLAKGGKPLYSGSSGEWLLDNFYILTGEYAALRGLRKGTRSSRMAWKEISSFAACFLEKHGYVFEESALWEALRARVATPFSSEALHLLPAAVSSSLLQKAAEIAKKPYEDGGMGTVIKSFLALQSLDMKEIFAVYSPIDALLSEDTTFRDTTFHTKELYRRAVSRLAREAALSDGEVTRTVLRLCREKKGPRVQAGYFLLGEGEHALRAALSLPPKKAPRLFAYYLISVALLSGTLLFGVYAFTKSFVWTAFSLLPALDAALQILEHIFLKSTPPRVLPRLALSEGIPEKVLIVFPTLLSSSKKAKEMVEKLEICFLANRDPNLCLAVLGDFKDSKTPFEDPEIPSAAAEEIARLNQKYGPHFFLLCRSQIYAARQGRWMGNERKRGALCDLNHFLRGRYSFAYTEGPVESLVGIRYVLTLDDDTLLPPGAAKKLFGTALHPQNTPRMEDGRVVSGYGIISPKISLRLESTTRTLFSRIFGGDGGISTYHTAASEFYMDMFGEAVFTGKGIYHVDNFLSAVSLPQDTVLSHDILEGGFLRCGIASDVEVFDSFPRRLSEFSMRLHRWTRGDWQNLPWLFKKVRDGESKKKPNVLSPLSKWKIFDNLRRSLTLPFVLLLLAFGTPRAMTLPFVMLFLPAFFSLVDVLLGKQFRLRRYFSPVWSGLRASLYRATATVAFLPHLAFTSVSAAIIGLYRLRKRKNTLEWVTAADAENSRKDSIFDIFSQMLFSLSFGLSVFLAFLSGIFSMGGMHLILSALFCASPLLAFFLGWETTAPQTSLSQKEEKFLRETAEKTWHFFRDYMTEEDHFLPPDNVQVSPYKGPAHRTSPTNIGLGLLACISAFDLGFIDRAEMEARIEKTMNTVEALATWNGHLYNWYDTRTLRPLSPRYISTVDSGNFVTYLLTASMRLVRCAGAETPLSRRLLHFAEKTDFRHLYSPKKKLFSIGFSLEENRLTDTYYDLLASEARQAVYFAVAMGQVPPRAWFALGRTMTEEDGFCGLISWSGTMFEYFMPRLIMKAQPHSLLSETYKFALHCQKRTGKKRKLPWGVSESGFYAFDKDGNYQYKAFGVSSLRLSRGDSEDAVIAPYAAALALCEDPKGAISSLRAMRKDGLFGEYGFFEAADYTRTRLSGNMRRGIVKSYMAHHTGMTLVSITNLLCDNLFQECFHAHPGIRAAAPLLSERIPQNPSVLKEEYKRESPIRYKRQESVRCVRHLGREETYPKSVHLLSNGSYHVFIDTDGQGKSVLDDVEYNSFSPIWGGGQEIKIINTKTGETLDGYGEKCVFAENAATYTAENPSVFSRLAVSVFPEENAELRRLTLMNPSDKQRTFEIYYYTPLSLTTNEAERAHPAFSKLFVTTRKQDGILFAERRKRSENEKTFCGFAAAICEGIQDGGMQFDTDRLSFLGRDAEKGKPFSLGRILSEKTGTVLDPCFAIKLRISIEAGMSGSVAFLSGLAETEARAKRIVEGYKTAGFPSLQSKESSLVFRQGEEERFLHAASFLLFGGAKIPEIEKARLENLRPREDLWKLGISGDLPIVTLRLTKRTDEPLLKEAIKAATYWKEHGIRTDLAIFCDEPGGYTRPVFEMAEKLKNGRMYVFGRSDVDHTDYTLLLAASALYLESGCDFSSLPSFAPLVPRKEAVHTGKDKALPSLPLIFDNGFGGFCKDTEEYVIYKKTPLPWVHIVANPIFGFLASESGGGYTWSENSQSFRLSPWTNDAARDPVVERLSLSEAGDIWSPMRGTFSEQGIFRTRYGPGYVLYERNTRDIFHAVRQFVPPEKAQKIIVLALQNEGEKSRELSVEYAFLPVLGTHPAPNTVTVLEKENCLRFRNALTDSEKEVYLSVSADAHYGKRGHEVYAKTSVLLRPGEKKEIVFVLGMGTPETVDAAKSFAEVQAYWDSVLHAVTVETGHAEMDLLMNSWLLYQVMACRLFARSAFYQSGGAFGFRDQLQDVLALIDTAPQLAKKQICLHAAHQFAEGDVFHWWHEDGRGVRTRFSDDRLFLPFVAAIYAEETGDESIWDLTESFVLEPPLAEGEAERYTFIKDRTAPETIYEHAVRAIEASLQKGPHDLPLMGGGDWNDGMNTVGIGGTGESVWLAWFLIEVLKKFSPFAEARGDHERAARYRREALLLAEAAELGAWDGTHYARAFFDDGTPLGTSSSAECTIDAISQAWAVLSGGARHDRQKSALGSVYNTLVDKESTIIKLLAPPFAGSTPSPGYIQSYPKGLRENGGQYTHGAIWVAMAFALLGEKEKAWELFRMLNPILHSETPSEAHIYKVEPYVMCADIYAAEGHIGRGGWSWYTGAAAWMYRLGLRYMVGFQRSGDTVSFAPSMPIPKDGICVRYRHGSTTYIFHVHGKSENIKLTDDGGVHKLTVG